MTTVSFKVNNFGCSPRRNLTNDNINFFHSLGAQVRVKRVLVRDLERSGNELEAAMQTVADEGRGIVVLLRESSKTSLSETIGATMSGTPLHDSSQGLREYGVGAQILHELGVRQMILLSNRPANVISLDGYDLEIVDWRRLNGDSA